MVLVGQLWQHLDDLDNMSLAISLTFTIQVIATFILQEILLNKFVLVFQEMFTNIRLLLGNIWNNIN